MHDCVYAKEKGLPLVIQLAAGIQALSFVVHHSTTCWLCTCVALHLITFDRALMVCTLPLIVQHWFIAMQVSRDARVRACDTSTCASCWLLC